MLKNPGLVGHGVALNFKFPAPPPWMGTKRDTFRAAPDEIQVCNFKCWPFLRSVPLPSCALRYSEIGRCETAKCGMRNCEMWVAVDGSLVTSWQPSDLPAFNREMLQLFSLKPQAAMR